MYSRRDLAKLAAAAVPFSMLAKSIDSTINGVRIGLQTYVFTAHVNPPHRQLADTAIQSMVDSGIGECDLFAPIIEPVEIWGKLLPLMFRASGGPLPPDAAAELATHREELVRWRASVSLDYYRNYRKKFNDAGIEIHGISGFSGDPSEFPATVQIANALGAKLITVSNDTPTAQHLAPIASKLDFIIGLQGRPDLKITNPDTISKPENFLRAVTFAKNYRISLDVGDAVGGGWDVLPFVREHADKLALIYLKDRRKDNTSVPWGEGDTPLREILQLVRDKRYPIRCYIDCDYPTSDRPTEVRRSLDFVKAALA